MPKEYIERRLLLDKVERVMDEAEYYGEWEDVCYFYNGDILDAIENAPTADVVEVVRCKDCKYSSFIKSCSKYECSKGCGALKFSNDFCSYGAKMIRSEQK